MRTELESFLGMLAGSEPPGRLLEIRYRNPHGPGMRQSFIEATRVNDAAAVINGLALASDTFTGVLLRDRPAGGKNAVSRSHLLFVEIDVPNAHHRLALAPAPPSAVITSGSPGHLHAYWQLTADVGSEQVEVGNRKLAGVIGGDLLSVDAARILRPPKTWNFKHQPAVQTHLEVLEPARRYSFGELTAHLPDPAPRSPATGPRLRSEAISKLTGPGTVDAQLRAITTEDYVLALTEQDPNAERKIVCPFPHHNNGQESTPSLQLRDGGEWNCFGCGTGGTIYDFAAHLWRVSTKGPEFNQLRDRLAATFRIAEPAQDNRETRASARTQLTPARSETTPEPTAAAGLER